MADQPKMLRFQPKTDQPLDLLTDEDDVPLTDEDDETLVPE